MRHEIARRVCVRLFDVDERPDPLRRLSMPNAGYAWAVKEVVVYRYWVSELEPADRSWCGTVGDGGDGLSSSVPAVLSKSTTS